MIPNERMATFRAYEELIKSLGLEPKMCSNIIDFIKMIYLDKRLLAYYNSREILKRYSNYDGMNSPSIYFYSGIAGRCYYGESFSEKLLKLYHDYPLRYRFYAGLELKREEVELYKKEVSRARR